MAQQTDLEGLRNQIVTQLFGRRMGFTPGNGVQTDPNFLAGPKGFREVLGGFSSGGTTITSTSVASQIPPYGFTAVGATGASATTAYDLAAPVPGIEKLLMNLTTGQAVIGTTAAGAFICSSGSITSTFGIITIAPKGAFLRLMGVTTALWAVTGMAQISTGGAAVTLV